MSCACPRALTKDQVPGLFGRFGVRFVFVVVVACSSLLCLARARRGFSVGLVFALCLSLLLSVRGCCVLHVPARPDLGLVPGLFGRFGVRFVFVVVVACSSLLCLARTP